jgi:TetR/AcrR family transcriptional repressor of nem operon
MARPREFELEAVAEGLLNTFWLHGFTRTSIGHLTEATGLLPGSLYAAFGSKEKMFRIAADRYVKELRAALSGGGPGIEGIQHVLNTVVRLTAKDPLRRGCLLINAIPESSSLSPETRSRVQRGFQEMRGFVRERLREAQDTTKTGGKKTPADLDQLASLVFAALVAIRVLGRAGQDRRLLQDIADGAVAAVRRCLEPG